MLPSTDLYKTIKKKYYYASQFSNYRQNNLNKQKINKQIGLIERYRLYFIKPIIILKNPLLWFGMIFMKTCEFGFGGIGYFVSKFKKI